MKVKPDLSFWKLWNISFGFFGVQIAYALQSANISRIFSTLGADPHNLSYFWILPPLAGIIVQPIVGAASDKTWTRFGRRIPYLFIGSLVAVLVMCLLPNAGSFGMAVSTAMIFDAKTPTLLGRYHHDSQFYLIKCKMSKNVLDGNIHYAYSDKVLDPCPWGLRTYYYGCTREGGHSGWLNDNLKEAENAPEFYGVTAKWTFNGKWDPEQRIRDLWNVLAY